MASILLDIVSDIQCQGLDCRGGVHRCARDQNAAVDDKQVWHVMASAVRIYHGVRTVGTHARCPHEMPTGWAQQGVNLDLYSPGSLQHFSSACHTVGHHL